VGRGGEGRAGLWSETRWRKWVKRCGLDGGGMGRHYAQRVGAVLLSGESIRKLMRTRLVLAVKKGSGRSTG